MLDLGNLHFRYEPYPIGIAKNVFASDLYRELLAAYPTAEQFKYKPDLGRKYSLSELNNPREYHEFIRGNRLWKEVHGWVKSRAFLRKTLQALDEAGVPLNLGHYANDSFLQRQRGKYVEFQSLAGLLTHLSARFEFSAMPANGGSIRPHCDAPNKLITLVVSMCDAKWKQEYGGGTAIVRPKDPKRYFNRWNSYLDFDQVETEATWEFDPNQCVIFVKTFNSWHAVDPIQGPADVLRKTLTINIERKWF